LADAVLTAPFAGTVLARLVEPDETVAAGRPVLRLADLRHLVVELGVPEQLVGLLDVGRQLEVTVGAFHGERFAASIAEVGAAAEPGTRLFRVKLAIANPDGRLRPGMSATVRIPGAAPPPDAVLVPLSALRGNAATQHFSVYVVEQAVARSRAVQVLDLIGSEAVVTGLAAGTTVVARGAGLCADGMQVEARP
jgi:RND family efflux transporter MFP subunit